jgi:hypothetical protein
MQRLSKTAVLLFPSPVPKKESSVWQWMQQHLPPPETAQLLQDMAGLQADTLAAAVFMFDVVVAAAGVPAPFTAVAEAAESASSMDGAAAAAPTPQQLLLEQLLLVVSGSRDAVSLRQSLLDGLKALAAAGAPAPAATRQFRIESSGGMPVLYLQSARKASTVQDT